MKIEEDLGFINILKRATKLLCGNINLVLFLFLCSLPLFCFLIFFELSLQTTVSLASQYLVRQLTNWDYYYVPQDASVLENLIPLLIQTFLLYLFPYGLIDLFTTTTIVSASWTVHTSEEEPLRFGQLVRRTVEICQNRLEGCLITSLYVLLLSTPVFFGFLFVATNYFHIISLTGSGENSYYYSINIEEDAEGYYRSSSVNSPVKMLFDAVLAMFHGAIFLGLLAMFSKWIVSLRIVRASRRTSDPSDFVFSRSPRSKALATSQSSLDSASSFSRSARRCVVLLDRWYGLVLEFNRNLSDLPLVVPQSLPLSSFLLNFPLLTIHLSHLETIVQSCPSWIYLAPCPRRRLDSATKVLSLPSLLKLPTCVDSLAVYSRPSPLLLNLRHSRKPSRFQKSEVLRHS